MNTPAKVWLWFLIIANVISLFSSFFSGTGMLAVLETLLILAAVASMLFLRKKAGFYLLIALSIFDIFFFLVTVPVLFVSALIGSVVKVGITWLCIRSSWAGME